MNEPEVHPALAPLVERCVHRFTAWTRRAPQAVAAAPGRVNLIGEHTDYNDGFVLPMAIDRWCVAAGSLGGNRVRSDNLGEETPYDPERPDAQAVSPWARYPVGVIWTMRRHVQPDRWQGVEAALVSSVPIGGGLSSSAAVELATGALVDRLFGVGLGQEELASVGHSAEHTFAGVPCGIMDQTISACAEAGAAMLLDCRTLQRRSVWLPNDAAIVIADSGVRHALASGEYAKRREACKRAAKALEVPSLRDADLEMVEAGGGRLDPEEFACARHVVTENARVLEFVDAIGKRDLGKAGALMVDSHRSLREDYHVSCPELDAMVEAACKCPGVYGSRVTGGGFGGCTVTLCDRDAAERVCEALRPTGPTESGRAPMDPFVATPVGGAAAWSVRE